MSLAVIVKGYIILKYTHLFVRHYRVVAASPIAMNTNSTKAIALATDALLDVLRERGCRRQG